MPQTNLTDLEDYIVEIDSTIEEDEAEEMEEISDELLAKLKSSPRDFNDWERSFVEDIYYKDKSNLSYKQIEHLYRLDRKFLR